MADDVPEVLHALDRLVSDLDDPSHLTDDQLVAQIKKAREAKKFVESKAAAALYQRGWSWRQIGKAIGVDHTTARGWALPYLREDERD